MGKARITEASAPRRPPAAAAARPGAEARIPEVDEATVRAIGALSPGLRRLLDISRQTPRAVRREIASALMLRSGRIRGGVTARILKTVDTTFAGFKVRVLLNPEGAQQGIGSALAVRAFNRALGRVSAYRHFLLENGVNEVRRWDDIPVMTKDNYVRRYDNPEILVDGKIPRGQVDQSSGSTGKPSIWYRSNAEQKHTGRMMRYGARAQVGNKPVSLINTFALGPWATGITVHGSLLKQSTTYSIGPDLDQALEVIRRDAEAARSTGEARIQLVAGYPPFLKALSDRLRELQVSNQLNLDGVELWAIGGGEAMTPVRRRQLLKSDDAWGFDRVLSSYGASDLTINVGVQDDWCIAVEDACAQNPALAEELFGRNVVPSVFHYDPTQYFIEHAPIDEAGERIDRLLFTQLSDVTCPKIRYDLGDEGNIRSASVIEAIFSRHGIELPARRHDLPMLAVFGRAENAVTYCGSKITPDHLAKAVSEAPLIEPFVGNLALNPYETDVGTQKLRFLLELKEGVSPEALGGATLDTLIDGISAQSQDFKKAVEISGRVDLELSIYEQGAGPNFHPNPNTKKRYIIPGNPPQ